MTANETLTLALSGLALAASVVSLRYARSDRAADDTSKQRDDERAHRVQLTEVLAELNRLQLEHARLMTPGPGQSPMAAAAQSPLLNQQNALLTGQAVDLVGRVPTLVSGIEYAMLATALANLGDLGQADGFWARSVERTPEPYFNALARRGYAMFLFGTGEVERGRHQFQQSLESMRGTGDYHSYTAGRTYMMWASAEANVRAYDRARQQLADAGRLFAAITTVGMRAQADGELAAAHDSLRAVEAGPRPSMPGWLAAAPHAARRTTP